MRKKSTRSPIRAGAVLMILAISAGACLGSGQEGALSLPYKKAIRDAEKVAELSESWRVMRGAGNSMLPLYGENSVLLVEMTDFEYLGAGMIAVYRDTNGDLVAHQVRGRARDGWITQGINNRREDPSPVTTLNFVGTLFGVLNASEGASSLSASEATSKYPVVYGKEY